MTGGFSFDGFVIDELEKLCKQYKLIYSIQNGKMVITPQDINQNDQNFFNISRNTYVLTPEVTKGLSPANDNSKTLPLSGKAKTKQKVVLTTFLIPATFDQFFTIPPEVSEDMAGTYRIKTIQYKLQSRGDAWDTILEGEQM